MSGEKYCWTMAAVISVGQNKQTSEMQRKRLIGLKLSHGKKKEKTYNVSL